MDKEPLLADLWMHCAAIAVLSFAGSRQLWLGLIALALGYLSSFGILSELHDPYVGPGILQEAGLSYVIHGHIIAVLCTVLPLSGLVVLATRGKEAAN